MMIKNSVRRKKKTSMLLIASMDRRIDTKCANFITVVKANEFNPVDCEACVETVEHGVQTRTI